MPVTSLLVWLLVVVVPTTTQAGSARMELAISPDLVAEADYWPGAADMPAILILHGFLQTREFPTVRRLAESLADEGFSVLTPSLTLGLNHRRQSLACEAIHTHTLTQDVAELSAWIDWLASRAGKAPVVIGHSTGGVQLAAMLDSAAAEGIAQAILVSITAFGKVEGAEPVSTLRMRAASAPQKGIAELDTYALGFCKDYVSTAAAFLSYLDWDHDRLRLALSGSRVPVTIIFGEKDDRVEREWLESVRGDNVTVRGVPGADHFFDLAHEFELLDQVISVMAEANRG